MARQAKALGYTLVALGTPEGASLDAVTAPIPCAGTIRYRRPIPCGGKGGVSSHANTVPTGRPDTTRHDSRSPLLTAHPHGGVPWEASTLEGEEAMTSESSQSDLLTLE